MLNEQSASNRIRSQAEGKIPGRPYTFVATLVAAFMVGLTVMALGGVADTTTAGSGGPPTTQPDGNTTTMTSETTPRGPFGESAPVDVSRTQLRQLGGISLGLAILSLIPSRRGVSDPSGMTPQMVAHTTGLPVIGQLFSAGSPKNDQASTGRLVKSLVLTCELLVCTAFMLTLAACFLNPELFVTLRHNPLVGYMEAMRQLAGSVHGWLHPGVTLG